MKYKTFKSYKYIFLDVLEENKVYTMFDIQEFSFAVKSVYFSGMSRIQISTNLSMILIYDNLMGFSFYFFPRLKKYNPSRNETKKLAFKIEITI